MDSASFIYLSRVAIALYSNSQPVTGYKIKKVERELPIAPNKELRLSYQRTTSIDTKLITLTKKHPRLLAVYIG
jgi:hypothetical protein